MLRNIQGSAVGSSLINVSQTSRPYVYFASYTPPQAVAGSLRYNPNIHQEEVFDGSTWICLGQDAFVSASTRLEHVVHWAEQKMKEEAEELELRKHPAAKDAYEQYKVSLELVKQHNIGGTP